jgi:phosphate transport system substrate-binding protein
MKTKSIILALGLASVITAGALAGDKGYDKKLKGSIKIDGSSTVYPITEAVAEEFAGACPRVRVTVGISGTGGGMKRFTAGETDISDASRPIKGKEFDRAVQNGIEFIEIPVAYDGLSIVVNKKNTWVDELTVDDLKMIFLDGSTARTWKDINSAWPAIPFSIYSPGTDSGTFDYFKEVIAGKKGSIRSDMSVSEDDNVLVRGVAGDKGGIGFFGCAYYFENEDKLRAIPIVNTNLSKAVMPTPETIESGDYAPFSRPLFIYVSKKSAERPEVQAFVRYFFEFGPELAEEVGYVRLLSEISQRAMNRFEKNITGTSYLTATGEQVHGPVTTVYK